MTHPSRTLRNARGRLALVDGTGRPAGEEAVRSSLAQVLARVARGDHDAFAQLYDEVAPAVFGTVRRVLRDAAQSEEVTQEVLVEVWRQAARFDAGRGSVRTWVLTIAHRRAVDRVRRAEASGASEERAARRSVARDFDEVAETVERTLEAEQVRRCLDGLTDLQRQSVTLAYYQGHTYAEVAELLGSPLGTVKTRMRDGLVRLRDCLGVTA